MFNLENYLLEVSEAFEELTYEENNSIDLDPFIIENEEISGFVPADYEDDKPLFNVYFKQYEDFTIRFSYDRIQFDFRDVNNCTGFINVAKLLESIRVGTFKRIEL